MSKRLNTVLSNAYHKQSLDLLGPIFDQASEALYQQFLTQAKHDPERLQGLVEDTEKFRKNAACAVMLVLFDHLCLKGYEREISTVVFKIADLAMEMEQEPVPLAKISPGDLLAMDVSPIRH